MKHQYLYLKVSNDEYEFPVFIADTVEELAELCGTSINSIKSSISRERNSGKWTSYKRVMIDDDVTK